MVPSLMMSEDPSPKCAGVRKLYSNCWLFWVTAWASRNRIMMSVVSLATALSSADLKVEKTGLEGPPVKEAPMSRLISFSSYSRSAFCRAADLA